MAPQRIYPRWLPPTPTQRAALILLRRRQTMVMVWLVGFIPAGSIVMVFTRSDVMLVPLTVLWIIAGVVLARRITAIPCPRCNANFCENSRLPYWYGLFNHRCENCGLTLIPASDAPE